MDVEYRKKKKWTCSSHQITVHAVTDMIKDDLRYTIRFAQDNKKEFLELLKRRSDAKTKRELNQSLKEVADMDARIKELDRIIQSLYEDKVAGKLSEER